MAKTISIWCGRCGWKTIDGSGKSFYYNSKTKSVNCKSCKNQLFKFEDGNLLIQVGSTKSRKPIMMKANTVVDKYSNFSSMMSFSIIVNVKRYNPRRIFCMNICKS